MNQVTQEHINKFEEPKDCFFYYGSNWCPGWAIGQIELPIVPKYSSLFFLVRDSSGECYWLPGNKVSFRGQSHLFESSYMVNSFDWNKINKFKPVL